MIIALAVMMIIGGVGLPSRSFIIIIIITFVIKIMIIWIRIYVQPNTHVISSIVHIAHEYDNDDEPWPIEIDDHDGALRAVDLKEGQVGACLYIYISITMYVYIYASIYVVDMISTTTVDDVL